MNNHRRREDPPEEEQMSAADLQKKYGGAHIRRRLPSDAFNRDRTPKGRSLDERNSGNGDQSPRGEVVRLSNVAESPSTRPPRNGVSWHLYEKCNLSVFIPRDAEIKEKEENDDLSARFSVKIGDAFVYISKELSPEPGSYLKGEGELKVKKIVGRKGKLPAYYPFANLVGPLENGEEPEYIVEFDSVKRHVPEGSKDFTPASGGERTIMHTDPFEPWDSNISSGITMIRK